MVFNGCQPFHRDSAGLRPPSQPGMSRSWSPWQQSPLAAEQAPTIEPKHASAPHGLRSQEPQAPRPTRRLSIAPASLLKLQSDQLAIAAALLANQAANGVLLPVEHQVKLQIPRQNSSKPAIANKVHIAAPAEPHAVR